MTPWWKLALAVFLLVPTPVAADWLQYGGDAARTGVAEGGGPEWPDVVLDLALDSDQNQISGQRQTFLGAPVVVHDTAYYTTLVGSDTVVWALNLSTGAPERFVDVTGEIYYIASDGAHLIAVGPYFVAALDLDTKRELWRHPVALQDSRGPIVGEECGPPVVAETAVFVGCVDDSAYPAFEVLVQGFSLDAAGTPLWEIPWSSAQSKPPVDPSTDCLDSVPCMLQNVGGNAYRDPWSSTTFSTPPQLSIVGDWVYVAVSTDLVWGDGRTGGQTLHAVDASSGEGQVVFQGHYATMDQVTTYSSPPRILAAPTGNTEWMFVKQSYLERYPADAPFWNDRDRTADFRGDARTSERDLGSGIGLAGDRIYAASFDSLSLWTLDLDRVDSFTTFVLPEGEAWDEGPPYLFDDLVIARATQPSLEEPDRRTVLYALDSQTGEQRWRMAFENLARVAAHESLLLIRDGAERLLVVGRSELSMEPSVHVTSQYPTVGEAVRVSLSASAGGLGRGPNSFRADWGDGTATDWQSSPVLEHKYGEVTDAHARFFARNDANQTASVPITFHVGQADPSANIFNSPFSDEYKETSFFLLGLLITGLIALFGIYRAGRKRRLFEKELRALEANHRALANDPPRCDAMLTERKARARELFLRKRLEDAQAAFLERRADEMRQGLRMGEVEERLKFLPYGMVQQLRRLLADGRVDSWERSHFMDAVERETSLSRAQRQAARRLIDGWFKNDVEDPG